MSEKPFYGFEVLGLTDSDMDELESEAGQLAAILETDSDMDELQSEADQLAAILQIRDGFKWVNRFRDQMQRTHELTSQALTSQGAKGFRDQMQRTHELTSQALTSQGARDLRLMEETDQIDEEADPFPFSRQPMEEAGFYIE